MNQNVLPSSPLLVTPIVPDIAWAKRLEMDNPRPGPVLLASVGRTDLREGLEEQMLMLGRDFPVDLGPAALN